MVRLFNICSISIFLVSSYVFGQNLYNNFPVTNGQVSAIVNTGGNIYIGGQFSAVGTNTGHGAGIDPISGELITGFPDVNGKIFVVVSDSAGGWYIGGKFSQVGGVERNCVAHIKSDKTVDSWNPNINNGITNNLQQVFTITKFGSTIYVGGLFAQVGSDLRTNVAAIDSATGYATSWNPQPDNAVYTILVTPLYTFLGGTFTYFGGAVDTTNPANVPTFVPSNKRQGVAELFTGQNILTMYNTYISGGTTTGVSPYGVQNAPGVYAMQLVNGKLYCAGNFNAIGNFNCNGLTAFDTANTYAPTSTGFSPNKNTGIKFRPSFSLAFSGDTVFVGGEFLYFGTLNTVRNHIAAALISTGAAIAWNPNIAINGTSSNESNYPNYVNSIVVSNSTVYVAGKFKTINGVSRSNIAAISQSGMVTVNSLDPNTSAEVLSIVLQGGILYAGGNFTSINVQARNNLASINALSGSLNPWNPNADGQVSALTVYGSNIFAGGYFSNIGSASRSYLAAIDSATGLAASWQANVSGGVSCLAVGNNLLYVGGNFSAIGGSGSGDYTRSDIGSVDPISGAVTSWDPNSDGSVYSLLVNGSTIYCGGSFGNIGGQPRSGIAALDATTGLAISWNPSCNALVNALGIQGSNIYAGGNFTSIGGQSRNYLACIDAATGNATSWNPNLSGGVNALAVTDAVIYAGGLFSSVGADTRNNIAAIDISSASATSWSPNPNNQVNAISLDLTNQKIYLGGNFTTIFNQTASNFGVVDDPGNPLPVELISFKGKINGVNVELNWGTATEKNSYGFEIQRSSDGLVFIKIGFVTGANLSNSPKEYSYIDTKLQSGKYQYRLKMLDNDGSFAYSAVEVAEVAIPKYFAVSQNYPNPFNPTTKIDYQVPVDAKVIMEVYNIAGQKIVELVNQEQSAGYYTVDFGASKLASGVYIYRLAASDKATGAKFTSIKKMMFLK